MKKIKTVIRAVLSAVILSCLVFGVVGCKAGKEEVHTGEWVITLEEAYKKKLLSKSDLREISEKFLPNRSDDDDTIEEKLILEFGAERIEAVKKAEAECNCEYWNRRYEDVCTLFGNICTLLDKKDGDGNGNEKSLV